jgi:hypothetical protein
MWLQQGYADYCENAVLKSNKRFAVSDAGEAITTGDWLFDLRRYANERKLKPLKEMIGVELRDYKTVDYVQIFGMVKFILESSPERFLNMAKHLREGRSGIEALEAATEVSIEKLEKPWSKWARGG